MNSKTIILVIVLFAFIVAGMFGYAFLKKKEMSANQEPEDVTQEEAEVPYPSITRIDGRHYFIDGVHTVVGEIPMPTPCDLLEGEAFVAESYPEQITLNFSVINNAEFCAQQVTSQRFKITATASEEATFSARFMDRNVELNLIPAVSGEKPEDFELFIKG